MQPPPIKVVFDTNILVAAYGWPGGKADRAYSTVRSGTVDLYVSEFILDEVARILSTKLGWEEEETAAALAQIRRLSREVHDPPESVTAVRGDPTDNRILECALAAGADTVVTGDKKHLLPLGTFKGIRIISLQEFLSSTVERLG